MQRVKQEHIHKQQQSALARPRAGKAAERLQHSPTARGNLSASKGTLGKV